MNKYVLFLGFFFLIARAEAQGINFFQGTWAEALEKAKTEEKVLFVDAFAQWCGPCKAMAKNVFTRDDVGKFFNDNFINLKLDMETPDGRTFGDKYAVSAYPTLFFIDEKGKVIKKVVGGQKPEGLIAHGKEALQKNDNSEDLAKLYEEGNRDYDFMVKYIKSLNHAGKPSLKIANDYLLSKPEITEEQNMLFVFEAATEADSKLFETVLANKSKIAKLVGEEVFNEKIKAACKATIGKSIEYDSPELFQEALQKSDKGLTADADKFRYASEMGYYQTFHQKEAYLKAAENLAKKAGKNDGKTLRFVAEDICKNYKDDPKVIKKAVGYASEVYKGSDTYDNLAFYCKTLLEAGDAEKAFNIAEEALEKARKNNSQEVMQFEGLVNYLKTKKEE
ncbi:MAG: thioredoxin family protein [Saprospiraceae bacterium]|nr:thioredoxin family protein [Saprospiraceae bacterium]